jgi:hypothetical protein
MQPDGDIASRLGRDRRRVRHWLARLAAVDLAVEGEHGWRRGSGDLDEAAHRLGVAGELKRQQTRHAEDREWWSSPPGGTRYRRPLSATPPACEGPR